MKRILIIGGGISGLSAALFLSQAKYKVELIEASPKLGGRVYSFNHNGKQIDNGQHILMECYSNTLEYIDFIGTRELFEFQKSLSTIYVNDKREIFRLAIPKNLYPLNRLSGFLKFKLLNFQERFMVFKLLLKIKNLNTNKFNDEPVLEFLKFNKQSDKAISQFWENLVVSTMNTSTNKASSKIFIDMMKIIFFSGKRSANIVIPKVDLSNALIHPAVEKLVTFGGKISASERATSIIINNSKVSKVITSKREVDDFDEIIFAIPEYSLRKIKIENSGRNFVLPKLSYSPIVTVHMLMNNSSLKEKMYSLIGSEFDWLFNHGSHLAFVKSNAEKLVTINKNLVIKIAFSELKKYFTILTNTEIKDFVVLKEKRATFISNLDSIKERKKVSNPFSNTYLIGDWVDTGLPATIESAVKSGKEVAEILNNKN